MIIKKKKKAYYLASNFLVDSVLGLSVSFALRFNCGSTFWTKQFK